MCEEGYLRRVGATSNLKYVRWIQNEKIQAICKRLNDK